jgi:hypothetical protein
MTSFYIYVKLKEENPYLTFTIVYDKEIQLTGINDVDFKNQFNKYVFKPADYNFAYDLSGEYIYTKDSRFHIYQKADFWYVTFNGDQVAVLQLTSHKQAIDTLGNIIKCFT